MSGRTSGWFHRNSGTRAIALALALAASAPAGAKAAILLQQPPALPNPPAAVSSSDFNVQAFDDFRLPADSVVQSLVWWAQDVGTATETFNIGFYSTALGGFPPTPGSAIYSATVTATSTHIDNTSVSVFQANLPTPAALPGAADLWVSIFDTSPGLNFAWAAATGTASPGALPAGLSTSRLANGTFSLGALEPAWQLNDSLIPGLPTAAPEPSGLALLAVGVLGLLVVARWQRHGIG
jgi:hypothetical protein